MSDLLDAVERENAGATYGAYKQKARHLVRVLGDIELGELTREMLLSYARHRKQENASDSTIHKELVVMRRALKEARDRGTWAGDSRTVVPTIKVRYRPRERWLTPAQASRLTAELEPHRRIWFTLATLAGLRLGEVERLEWSHVDIRAKRIRAPGTKTAGSWRLVPIHPDLARQLNLVPRPKRTGRVVQSWRNVRRDLRAAVVRLNKAAKRGQQTIPVVSPNDLRRTFASWLKQRGVDSLTVARMLGHESTRMVELVYGKLDDATYEQAMRKMPRLAA